MNKIFRNAFVALMTVAGLSSCVNEYEYDPITVSGDQVYFSKDLATTQEISTSASSFTIPVQRQQTTDAVSVPLTVTQPENSIFTVPTSVSFAAGQDKADLVISYDPAKVEYGNYENITITIGDASYQTAYGLSSYSFAAGVTAWVKMAGKATYREDLVTSTWSGVENLVYEVDIEENIIEKGMYRLVNPYGEIYEYNDPGDWDDTRDYYLVIDATDPDWVHIPRSELGVDWGYGMWQTIGYADYYVEGGNYSLDDMKRLRPQWFGTMKDGVITMPAGSVLFDYGGGLQVGNKNGLFAMALPGAVIADYSLEWAYEGRFTDIADNDYVRGEFTFGEDVEYVQYGIVPNGTDINEAVAGILDGSIESKEITASGSSEYLFNEATGKYVLVALVYANNEVVSTESYEFKFTSSKDNTDTYEPVAAGILTLGVEDLSGKLFESGPWGCFYEAFDLKEPIVGEAILSQSTADPTKFVIAPFYNDDSSIEFYYNAEDNTIIVEDVPTGVSSPTGAINVWDLNYYFEQDLTNYGVPPSHYDAEEDAYIFNLLYRGSDGSYAAQTDMFEVTDRAAARAMSKAFQKAAKYSKINGQSHQSGKKSLKKQPRDKKNLKQVIATKAVIDTLK